MKSLNEMTINEILLLCETNKKTLLINDGKIIDIE